MPKKCFFALFALLSWIGLFGQKTDHSISHYLSLVGESFQAGRAFETTRFVSEQWRVPGNTGFDTSIMYVQRILQEAGYAPEASAEAGMPYYRLERYPLRRPAWDPIDAQVHIVGRSQALLDFSTNRNMIAINSFSTPEGGVEAALVYLKECSASAIKKANVRGKIVMAECSPNQLFQQAVIKAGAIGVLAYRMPAYNQPEKHQHSIPFRSISFHSEARSWAINLSYAARESLLEALEAGPVRLKVRLKTRFFPSEELTLIAEIPGQARPDERFVFSAHVQEPGANDNASGVGTLAEMARVAAMLYQKGQITPQRSLSFLWGHEIRSTRRFIQQDPDRARGIRWGLSLDMVGEDTDKTGGTFLIEKMPDPSAIWTRGEDKHTEWGAARVELEDLRPHYFNDFMEQVCRTHARRHGWTVNTNPFEGGSDHQPFLNAGIPALLLWHFTDVFYHTDADRIDKVSPQSLYHVGTSALSAALLLCQGGNEVASALLDILDQAAARRLEAEAALSKAALDTGQKKQLQKEILEAWSDWYLSAFPSVKDVLLQPERPAFSGRLQVAIDRLTKLSDQILEDL